MDWWTLCAAHCCPTLPCAQLHTAQWQSGPPPPMPLLHRATPQEILAKRTLRHHREQHPLLHLTLVPVFITKHCVIYFHIMTFPSCLSSPSLLVDLDFGFSKKVLSCLPQSFAGNKKPAQLTKVGALLLKVAESFFWRKPQTTVQCWVGLFYCCSFRKLRKFLRDRGKKQTTVLGGSEEICTLHFFESPPTLWILYQF